MPGQIAEIVKKAIVEVNDTLDNKIVFNAEGDAALYGNGGFLDSMSLVSLIVIIEQYLEAELNISIILANEKAMSQRNSPFATYKALVSYVSSMLNAEVDHVQ